MSGHAGEHPQADEPLRGWLIEAANSEASDLHVIDGYRPVMRLHGALRPLGSADVCGEPLRRWLLALMPPAVRQRFDVERNADFALELPCNGRSQRFRANYFYAAEQLGACFRVIPRAIPDFEWAGFPRDLAERLAGLRNGLVIFCGVTGSGKTTTLAMLIDLLCHRGGYRVVTIEQPIEYLYRKDHGSIVTQREVGRDVNSFDEGLKYGLRQDPDVILVGEIRDRETAQTALRAAETGHLVFATLHSRDAKGAISRYADLFSLDAQHEVRAQLAGSLRAVISQHLLPGLIEGDKRRLALEVMFNNSPIAIAIRSGRLDSIDNTIQTSRADGMLPLSQSVRQHLHAGDISIETAARFVSDPAFLR